MDILARGKYVITDAAAGEDGIISNGAACFSGGKVTAVGGYRAMKKKYPDAKVVGNGRQLLMPGLIDGHSHGWGLTCIQRGMTYDYLENALIDWASLIDIDPEINAQLCAVRHLRGGCTTIHHNNFGEAPQMGRRAEQTIKGYRAVGIRFAYSPGVRNENTLALDDTEFLKTLPPDLQEFCRPMVEYDKEAVVDEYFEIFDGLYANHHGEESRIIHGPSWVQGSTDDFLRRVKASADAHGKLPIHIHTLQTPYQKAYGLKKYGKSLLGHLDDLGLVDGNLVLGHAVFVNQQDIALLAAKGASTTNHPSCNLAVRNGISPVYEMLRAGVNVALGIDDKGINDDDDAIMELRMIHFLHRVSGFGLADTPPLTAFDTLKIGTINAARVSGFPDEIGALKPGMKADAILVDLEQIMENPWMSPDLNIAEIFIHRARGTDVNTAIVGGEVVMEDRQFLNIDVAQLYKEASKAAAKGISEEQKQFAARLQSVKPYYHQWYADWEMPALTPFYVMNSGT